MIDKELMFAYGPLFMIIFLHLNMISSHLGKLCVEVSRP